MAGKMSKFECLLLHPLQLRTRLAYIFSKTNQCPTEIRYREPKPIKSFGIGIGAVTLSAETEIALYCIFLGQQTKKEEKERERKKQALVKMNSTKPYFTSVCNRALHPQSCLVKGVTRTSEQVCITLWAVLGYSVRKLYACKNQPKFITTFEICGFGIGYGIGRKYRPITVSVSVSD